MADDLNEAAAHCPTCGAEYRAGFEVCADDGTPLVAGPPFEEPPQAPEPEPAPEASTPPRAWRTVATLGRQDEARLLVGRLRAEGVEALVFPEDSADYYGPATQAWLGRPWEVLVPEGSEDTAARILQEIRRG